MDLVRLVELMMTVLLFQNWMMVQQQQCPPKLLVQAFALHTTSRSFWNGNGVVARVFAGNELEVAMVAIERSL